MNIDKMARDLRKHYIILYILLIFLVYGCQEKRNVFDGDTKRYCAETFEKTRACPEDKCMTDCGPGSDSGGCAPVCVPKFCQSFSISSCPFDVCQIMENCNNEKICYSKLIANQKKCGQHGYYGQDVECCESLKRTCGIPLPDGSCENNAGGYDNLPVCLNCGNGTCDVLENRCNCPEDCS